MEGTSDSEVGTCTGMVELYKHLLHATAHPQIFVLELRAPMGACLRRYGVRVYNSGGVAT